MDDAMMTDLQCKQGQMKISTSEDEYKNSKDDKETKLSKQEILRLRKAHVGFVWSS